LVDLFGIFSDFGGDFGDGACAFQISMAGWATGYNYQCQPVDYTDNPMAIRVS